MVILNCVPAVRPESNPAVLFDEAARKVQGAAKDDWVTEC